ncbi:MAG: hypothetical protein K0S36_1589 [Nitrosospira multiformis]|jgi:hypothetical protein|nr:hypothetical protein [Nitrosospira multiformis]
MIVLLHRKCSLSPLRQLLEFAVIEGDRVEFKVISRNMNTSNGSLGRKTRNLAEWQTAVVKYSPHPENYKKNTRKQ